MALYEYTSEEANPSCPFIDASDEKMKQSFTAISDHAIDAIKVMIGKRNEDALGTVTLAVYATDANGYPTGSALTSGTMAGDDLPAWSSEEFVEFSLTETDITNTNVYAIQITCDSFSGTNYIAWMEADTYADGSFDRYTSGAWEDYQSGAFDVRFEVYGPPYVTLTTLTPLLVEDGRAVLRMSLDDKSGSTIAEVGWYCDENAAPSTSFTFDRSLWDLPADLETGEYPQYIKTLTTGQTTLYVQAWAEDDGGSKTTDSVLSFEVPLSENAEYTELPDLIFPAWFAPSFDFDINLDIYLDKDYEKANIDNLRKKCIRYENAYTDMCLVVNHNTKLIKNWLQSVYNDGTYFGENELFAKIHPSQQLAKLELDTLEVNDFKGIIDRFINNNTANVIALNHNFDLFKEWVNDYNYGSRKKYRK